MSEFEGFQAGPMTCADPAPVGGGVCIREFGHLGAHTDGHGEWGSREETENLPSEPPVRVPAGEPPLRAEPLDLPPPKRFADNGPKRVPGPNDELIATGEPPRRGIEVLLSLPYEAPLTDEEEQRVREHWGYTASEKRTRLERAETAGRIVAKLKPDTSNVVLPEEVVEIWGVSEQSLDTATTLIAAWGVERFLNSELHTQAVKERESDARMAPIRAAYVKAMKEKK